MAKYKRNRTMPKKYKISDDFIIPQILIKQNKEYIFVKKLRYLYQYKREYKDFNGRIKNYYECFDRFEIRLLEFYKGEVY